MSFVYLLQVNQLQQTRPKSPDSSDENYPFDRWFGFLRAYNLVLERDATVFITVAGREFLKYLVATGKSGPYHG